MELRNAVRGAITVMSSKRNPKGQSVHVNDSRLKSLAFSEVWYMASTSELDVSTSEYPYSLVLVYAASIR